MSLTILRRMSTKANAAVFETLAARMEYAFEMALTANESASQKMLETDPSARLPRSTYLVHYQAIALEQVLNVLNDVTTLQEQMGPSWQAFIKNNQPNFALKHADLLLLRDNLTQSIRQLEEQLDTSTIQVKY